MGCACPQNCDYNTVAFFPPKHLTPKLNMSLGSWYSLRVRTTFPHQQEECFCQPSFQATEKFDQKKNLDSICVSFSCVFVCFFVFFFWPCCPASCETRLACQCVTLSLIPDPPPPLRAALPGSGVLLGFVGCAPVLPSSLFAEIINPHSTCHVSVFAELRFVCFFIVYMILFRLWPTGLLLQPPTCWSSCHSFAFVFF